MTDPAQVGSAAPRVPTGVFGGLTGLVAALIETAMTPPEHFAADTGGSAHHDHARDAVCRHCPICALSIQAERLDPKVVTDLATVARDLLVGLAGSMAAAKQDRTGDPDL
jgi:hypothetical protein